VSDYQAALAVERGVLSFREANELTGRQWTSWDDVERVLSDPTLYRVDLSESGCVS
jgi:hypothetical protein